MSRRAGANDADADRWLTIRAAAVGAAVPLAALAATEIYLSSLKEIDDGLEGLIIVPVLFVLGCLAPFAVKPAPKSIAWLVGAAVTSGAVASTVLGIGPGPGVTIVLFAAVPGIFIGSLVHDAATAGLTRLRRRKPN